MPRKIRSGLYYVNDITCSQFRKTTSRFAISKKSSQLRRLQLV
jgi:hypothetical protein